MKTAIVFAATAALVSAQATYNSTDGTWTCATANVAYCAGGSLSTDIIIRCDASGKGQPGRCTDNLAGEPPLGVNPALCYQSSETAGDAACEKNCVVYGTASSSTLPSSLCTPYYSSTTSTTVYPTTTSTTSTTAYPTTTTSSTVTYPPTSSTTLSTCTTSTTVSALPPPPAGNGTCSSCVSSTHTVTGPTTTSAPPPVITAGAAANKVGGALAVMGLAVAYFL